VAVADPDRGLVRQLQAGDIVLPWASIAGFVNVFAVMAVVIWLAAHHERRPAARPNLSMQGG
jgi:hypothetical protein